MSGVEKVARWKVPFDVGLIVAFSTVIALALWYSLPPFPIPVNDDFGYYRSIVETLQHKRPWTDEWLEPWAASLSTISASVFAATGNFRLATYGVLSVFAGLIALFSLKLLRLRGVSLAAAILWILVFFSFPTVIWKLFEFGAVPLYVACLVACLWAAERRRWWLFYGCWFIAVSSRQSALGWLALPIVTVLLGDASTPKGLLRRAATAAGIAGCGAIVYLGLSGLMNATHAQSFTWPDIASHLTIDTFRIRVSVAMAVFVIAAGLGSLVYSIDSKVANGPRHVKTLAVSAVACAAIALSWHVDLRRHLLFEHGIPYGDSGRWPISVLILAAIAGWIVMRPTLRLTYVACGLAAAGLIGLRPLVWDYYLLDPIVFGFFSVSPALVNSERRWRGSVIASRCVGYGAGIALLWLQSGFVSTAKAVSDGNFALVSLYEKALRDHKIQINEISSAPFGYKGWHLYPYFVTFDGKRDRPIWEFLNYVRLYAVWDRVDSPALPQPVPGDGRLTGDDEVIASDVFRASWVGSYRVSLIRKKGAASAPFRPATYRFEPFPETNEEWRDLVRRGVPPKPARPESKGK